MSAKKPSVLLTGASSGIGRATALELCARGFRVFAGVRKPEDGEALVRDAKGALTPVAIDVTDAGSVRTLAERLGTELSDGGLDALVNNAGVSVSGPLELLPIELFERQMAVNVTGQLIVTQAFLPLLRRARGRIVFVGSYSGRFTLPLLGAYSASKHAIEAISNAFRQELRDAGVRVTVIEPGQFQSDIWKKADVQYDESLAAVPRIRELYATSLAALRAAPKFGARTSVPARFIARRIHGILTARWPRARYRIGIDAHFLITWFTLAPAWLADASVRLAMRVLARFETRRTR